MKIVANKIIKEKLKGEDLVVVVSAMGKTTNNLYNLAKLATIHPNKRDVDLLLATGEMVSISLLSIILNDLGSPAVSLTGAQAGIKTAGVYTKTSIIDIDIGRIKKELSENKIVVVAGFQGVNELGDITTIGREGSDTTAVALANSLKCSCEIYTDVEGVYTVDPNKCPHAKKLDSINYEEMQEMSKMGSKVVAQSAIELAKKNNVPVYLASTYKDAKGTYINDEKEKKEITGIAVNDKNIILEVICKDYNNIISKIINSGYKVDLISSQVLHEDYYKTVISITGEDLDLIDEVINDLKVNNQIKNLKKFDNLGILSIIGRGEKRNYIFYLLKYNCIDIKYEYSSNTKISVVIDKEFINESIRIIGCYFDLFKEVNK